MTDNLALRTEIMINYSSAKVENYGKAIESSYGIALGPEWRAGSGKVQGFYGFMGEYISVNSKTVDDNGNTEGELASSGGGLRFFLGAECFVAPKFAIGSQISWGPAYIRTTDVDSDIQVSVFDISTKNIQGALMLTYYF